MQKHPAYLNRMLTRRICSSYVQCPCSMRIYSIAVDSSIRDLDNSCKAAVFVRSLLMRQLRFCYYLENSHFSRRSLWWSDKTDMAWILFKLHSSAYSSRSMTSSLMADISDTRFVFKSSNSIFFHLFCD